MKEKSDNSKRIIKIKLKRRKKLPFKSFTPRKTRELWITAQSRVNSQPMNVTETKKADCKNKLFTELQINMEMWELEETGML